MAAPSWARALKERSGGGDAPCEMIGFAADGR
jgi:hypothetical protein